MNDAENRAARAAKASDAEIERLRDVIREFRKREQSQDAIRELLTRERDAARAAYDKRFREFLDNQGKATDLLATIERVQALHRPTSARTLCLHEGKRWPCPTIQALEQP